MVFVTVTSPVLVGHVGTVAADAVCVTTNAAVTATMATQIAANKPARRLLRGCIAASPLSLAAHEVPLVRMRTIGLGKRFPDCGRAYVASMIDTTRRPGNNYWITGNRPHIRMPW
ncbi:hypothetical protein GCM10029978_048480 [Actinoallomurus acanthiterrae]